MNTDGVGAVVAEPSDRTARLVGATCGILGALALAVYFGAPTLLGWPYAGASGSAVAAYARSHETLFYGGAWLQVTGTLLSVVLFLVIIRLARATDEIAGLLTLIASGVLLATVVVEAAFLVAVPIAASAGDATTANAMFTLSNGVFVRVFPLAPASATFVGLGIVLLRSPVLGRGFGYGALALGVAFEVAGALAIVSVAGIVFAIVLSVGQGLWVVAAAASVGMMRPSAVQAVHLSNRSGLDADREAR